MNKLVKRILGTLLTERLLTGNNPKWTELGMVAATINSQHGRGKDDVYLFEVVYGQVLNHDMSCSKVEAHQRWTLPQFLKVTNYAEFAEYTADNYNLDEDSTDVAEQDNSGYFSDEELQEDEKEEVTDDDFFNLLNTNILESDTSREQPAPQEDNINLEGCNHYVDTVGLVNYATLFDVEVTYNMDELQWRTADSLPLGAGDWQVHTTAQGCDANDDYNQTRGR